MPDIAIEILAGARNLLADPERWTQGAAARNAAGKHVAPSDPDATCPCTTRIPTASGTAESASNHRQSRATATVARRNPTRRRAR